MFGVWLVGFIQKHDPVGLGEWSCLDICGRVCHDGDIVTSVVFTPSDRMVLQIFKTSMLAVDVFTQV